MLTLSFLLISNVSLKYSFAGWKFCRYKCYLMPGSLGQFYSLIIVSINDTHYLIDKCLRVCFYVLADLWENFEQLSLGNPGFCYCQDLIFWIPYPALPCTSETIVPAQWVTCEGKKKCWEKNMKVTYIVFEKYITSNSTFLILMKGRKIYI